MKKIAINLITLNNYEYVKNTLDSLFASDLKEHIYKLFLYINNCDENDNRIENLIKSYKLKPKARIIKSKENKGIVIPRIKLFNEIKNTWSDSLDYMLEIHDDMLFPSKWLNTLLEAKHDDYKILMPVIYYNYPMFENPDKLLYQIKHRIETGERLDCVQVHPCLYEFSALLELGYYDKRFSPQISEDDDLYYRFIKKGYHSVTCLNSIVFHGIQKTRTHENENYYNGLRKFYEKNNVSVQLFRTGLNKHHCYDFNDSCERDEYLLTGNIYNISDECYFLKYNNIFMNKYKDRINNFSEVDCTAFLRGYNKNFNNAEILLLNSFRNFENPKVLEYGCEYGCSVDKIRGIYPNFDFRNYLGYVKNKNMFKLLKETYPDISFINDNSYLDTIRSDIVFTTYGLKFNWFSNVYKELNEELINFAKDNELVLNETPNLAVKEMLSIPSKQYLLLILADNRDGFALNGLLNKPSYTYQNTPYLENFLNKENSELLAHTNGFKLEWVDETGFIKYGILER